LYSAVRYVFLKRGRRVPANAATADTAPATILYFGEDGRVHGSIVRRNEIAVKTLNSDGAQS